MSSTLVSAPAAQEDTFVVQTTRFGPVTVAGDDLLRFEAGLLGFADACRFALVPAGAQENASPFVWLQCVDRPDLAFLLLRPGGAVFPDYAPLVLDENQALFVIVTVPGGDALRMTANLLGPIVIDTRVGEGRQTVLDDASLTTRHRVFAPASDTAAA